jgi:hypothetical protein
MQQLREAFPEAGPYRYAIFDRDSTFNVEVVAFLEAAGLRPKRTSIQAPWQNGVAERWTGSARRDWFDHVIALNEAHVRRLGREFLAYYHEDRTHLGLDKDTPSERPNRGQTGWGGIGIAGTSRRLTSSIHLESGRVNMR